MYYILQDLYASFGKKSEGIKTQINSAFKSIEDVDIDFIVLLIWTCVDLGCCFVGMRLLLGCIWFIVCLLFNLFCIDFHLEFFQKESAISFSKPLKLGFPVKKL